VPVDASAVGEVTEVIEDAPEAERPVGRLRVIAAALSIVASGGAPRSFMLVAAVIAASLFWWRSFRSVEHAHAAGERKRLVLGTEGMALEGPGLEGETSLAWSTVTRIELDHDRLRVDVVHARGVLSIEPPLGGLGLEGLGQRVHAAYRQALSNRSAPPHNSARPRSS
jgi:hypothetical protein